MTRSVRRTAVLAGLGVTGAAALLTMALVVPGIAQAVDPTPNPSTSAAPGTTDREQRRTERQAELAAALAKELGVDQAKVAAALEKVRTQQRAEARTERIGQLKTRLDEAVAAGKLTRAEADAIVKAAENGVLPGGGKGFAGRHGR